LAELIREKIFLLMRQEIPYSVNVEIEKIEEKENGVFYVKANIFTTEQKYRKILIGRGGQKIKEFGQMARKEMEQVLNKKVYIDLDVKIDPHWQERFI
jgi:GTP-binding protein Era